jgi:hypothetical protein
MLLGAAAAFWNLYRRRFEYFVLLCGWLYMGLNVRRNMPLFSIICAPFVAEAVYCWLRDLQGLRTVEWIKSLGRRFEETAAGIAETDRLPRLYAASALAFALLVAILYAPQPPKMFQSSQDPKEFPVEAANVLLRDGDNRIFTTDVWGGYLIYRLYPKAKVFIDGRSDLYGAAFELKYLDVISARYDWEQNLNHYGPETVVIPADAPLTSALKENRRWRVVYDDKVSIIFRLAVPAQPFQQVSNCPDQGVGEYCGKSSAGATSLDVRAPRGSVRSKNNYVAEISPPRLPLLNRP